MDAVHSLSKEKWFAPATRSVVAVLIAFNLWFVARLVATMDRAVEEVQLLNIRTSVVESKLDFLIVHKQINHTPRGIQNARNWN